jgi:RHS repeat-associated protein
MVSTAYIYGPRGLLGFIRNGAFHSVWTDHSGSIRLVLKDGQVVAAYDYLPYGQLMRSYGSDPAAEIFYRYTGQEWDEETGLYNYHARLYDPDIGRFYQPDPREQYFSPYKYVGNSPVSLVDPDGEFGLLALAAVGALALG